MPIAQVFLQQQGFPGDLKTKMKDHITLFLPSIEILVSYMLNLSQAKNKAQTNISKVQRTLKTLTHLRPLGQSSRASLTVVFPEVGIRKEVEMGLVQSGSFDKL